MDRPCVLVVEERDEIARRLRALDSELAAFDVLGPVPDARSAAEPIAKAMAEVALVDLDRIDRLGLQTVARLVDAVSGARVLAATVIDGAEIATAALAVGACGVVSRWDDAASLVAAFRRARRGEVVVPAGRLPAVLSRLDDDRLAKSAAVRMASLTPRELEVLSLVAEGWSTTDIARTMSITPLTVQSHVKNILAKLRVHSKIEAVRVAWRHGAIDVPVGA